MKIATRRVLHVAASMTLSLTAAAAATAPARAAAPVPVWSACQQDPADPISYPDRLTCTDVTVPLDWAQPGGPTIDLVVAKLPAADPARRIGALYLSSDGVRSVMRSDKTLSRELTERFDIVGMDTRGRVSPYRETAGTPLFCPYDPAIDKYSSGPRTSAEYSELRTITKKLADDCRQMSGALTDHIDTATVARDVEAVRVALAEPQLTFFGLGEGVMVGQQYAEFFPNRVRGMALDGGWDHSQTLTGIQTSTARGAEGAFNEFVRWCARTADCALHGTDVAALFDRLYARAETGDLTDADGNPVTPAQLSERGVYLTAVPQAWFHLADDLRALDEGSRRPAASAAAAAAEDDEFKVRIATTAALCTDFHLDTRTFGGWKALQRTSAGLSPHTRFNPNTRYVLTRCQGWPTGGSNPPHTLKASPELPPMLITGNQYSPYEPYEWAQSLARQLPSATLLTNDGVGGGYGDGSCSQQAIDTYLLTGRTPAKGTHCPADYPTTRDDAGPAVQASPQAASRL